MNPPPLRLRCRSSTARCPLFNSGTSSGTSSFCRYAELLKTEGVKLEFTADGLDALAEIAYEVNQTTQNIGARRLHTVLERVVEDISFQGPDLPKKRVVIDAKYVRGQLAEILRKEDLSKFIL